MTGDRDVKLLDDEGEMSVELEAVLQHIFNKYAVDGVLTREKIREWSIKTNGAANQLSEENIDEIIEFMDVDDANNLTFQGFLQIYQLQTENDAGETLKDLEKHGYNNRLQLKAT